MELFPFMNAALNFAKKQKSLWQTAFDISQGRDDEAGYQRDPNVDQRAQETSFVPNWSLPLLPPSQRMRQHRDQGDSRAQQGLTPGFVLYQTEMAQKVLFSLQSRIFMGAGGMRGRAELQAGWSHFPVEMNPVGVCHVCGGENL